MLYRAFFCSPACCFCFLFAFFFATQATKCYKHNHARPALNLPARHTLSYAFLRPRSICQTHKPSHPSTPRVFVFLLRPFVRLFLRPSALNPPRFLRTRAQFTIPTSHATQVCYAFLLSPCHILSHTARSFACVLLFLF